MTGRIDTAAWRAKLAALEAERAKVAAAYEAAGQTMEASHE